jgi:hypothetical protein
LISLACLSATGFAFDLECSQIVKRWWAKDYATCIVTDFTITERGAVMNPSEYDDNDEIKELVIRNQTVHYVPTFTVKFAKRLKRLEIKRCGLKEVRKEDLEQFPQLKYL